MMFSWQEKILRTLLNSKKRAYLGAVALPANKRMQSDQATRYARVLAADARRYVALYIIEQSLILIYSNLRS